MAFPWIFYENFELGTKGGFDTETDTDAVLDFPHASDLAGLPVSVFGPLAPFRGAFCVRVALNGGTNAATLTEGDIDIADGGTAWFRFMLYLSPNFTATATDDIALLTLEQAGGTVEATIGLAITSAGLVSVGACDGPLGALTAGTPRISKGVWHAIEVKATCSTGGAGVIQVLVDGVSHVNLTSQTHAAAIGQGKLGVQGHLATTTGLLLFDEFVMDDARIYPIADRYPRQLLLTKSSHVFIGPGVLENVSLLGGSSTDSVLAVFDTSRGNTNDANKVVVELKAITASDIVDPAGMPVQVQRGAFVQLAGTAPRAIVSIGRAGAYSSPGAVRTVAAKLKLNPLEVL